MLSLWIALGAYRPAHSPNKGAVKIPPSRLWAETLSPSPNRSIPLGPIREGVVTEAVGFLAALVSSVMFLPQAARVWRMRNDRRSLRGVSPLGQVMLLINATLWGLYALLAGAYWAGVPGLLNFPLACATLLLLLRARGLSLSNENPHSPLR